VTSREHLAKLCRDADPFGEAHVVIADLNVDDENLTHLAHNKLATADEREMALGLLAMPENDREPFLLECGC
jgi:hypothetical protein